ncbi:hypothetical protein ACWGDE_06900 [Streptomyces sp. NPDC054956]
MRTVFRTPLVTAALAGALLTPAATAIASAYVSASASAPAPAPASASADPPGPSDPSADARYGGETVLVGKGRIAVLRNGPEGPEAWIRAVAPDWKPADGWAGRVLAKVDRAHPRTMLDGTRYDLVATDDAQYGLRVWPAGAEAAAGFYPLPTPPPRRG